MSSQLIAVINGPNLAQLGSREPEYYGTVTQDQLLEMLEEKAREHHAAVSFFQSDIEGEIVKAVNSASGNSAGLIINPAAYSHYSIAILDAMTAFQGPVAEVHLSPVFARESFRQSLVTAMAADVFISGAGVHGYLHAIDILLSMSSRKTEVR